MIAVPRAGLRGKAEVWALPTHPHPRDPKAVESKHPFLPLPNPHILSIIPTGLASCLSAVKHELRHRKYQHGQPDSTMPGRGQGKTLGAGLGCLPELAFGPSVPQCTDHRGGRYSWPFHCACCLEASSWQHPRSSQKVPWVCQRALGKVRKP